MAYGRKTSRRRGRSYGTASTQRRSYRRTRVRRASGPRKSRMSGGRSNRAVRVVVQLVQPAGVATSPTAIGQKSMRPVRAMF